MKKGQRVSVEVEGQKASGTILIASENLKSLMVGLDEPLRVKGGVYVNMLPLLMDDDGEYLTLIEQAQVGVADGGPS
jgi:hypothetical protein